MTQTAGTSHTDPARPDAGTSALSLTSGTGGGGGLGGGKGLGSAREVSDEELVQRIREGESAAGEALCRRYHTPLFRYLQRLCRSSQVAEELYQQTWLSVLEHLDKFDPASSPGGFKAWLFRIGTNKVNDHWRSKGRQRTVEAAFADGDRSAEAPAASAPMESRERLSALSRAIEKLPEAQRQILMLRYYSGLRFVEIAQLLGCPLNTALGRMHKAVLKLRAILQE